MKIDFLAKEEDISKEYLLSMGFDIEAIERLLNGFRRDLKKEIGELEEILDNPSIDLQKIKDKAHAIKGLLAQAGDEKLALEFDFIKNESSTKRIKNMIKNILENRRAL